MKDLAVSLKDCFRMEKSTNNTLTTDKTDVIDAKATEIALKEKKFSLYSLQKIIVDATEIVSY